MTNVEVSTRTVRRADGTSIRYTASGPATGPTWVHIHGLGCRRTDFTEVTAFLPADHRVIAVDLAGHGDSTSDRTTWSMREFAEDVAAVTDVESVERCVVVGHSLGGVVAVELARLRPDLVSQVIGLDAFHYLTLYPAIEETAARALVQTFEADFAAGMRGLVNAGSVPDTDPAFTEETFRKMTGIAPSVGTSTLAEMLRWNMDEALLDIGTPVSTLAVRALLDPEAVQRYGDQITFVVHDLGSHHFHVEQPEATAKLLLAERID
ncbi:alpha/beta fold hydrolase [Pseudonocardia spinosispora]|uniref:alpha/beta fold hydrolase n=1 Tax=Pseudonocardia spinosispora TaxID=103441 RepID=UPI00042A3C89|nr:alpha/beta hydrolase [Pseudonocardia spinosispora]